MTFGDAAPPDDPPADPESVARTICLRLLTLRSRTRAELAEALRRRLVPDEVAECILDQLTGVGLIDDKMFAQLWVGSRHSGRGFASRALAGELRSRGVAANTVAEAVAAVDPATEMATARRLVQRKLSAGGSVSALIQMRRLVAMLGRKGYPPAMAGRVVREALADAAGDEELAALETLSDGA